MPKNNTKTSTRNKQTNSKEATSRQVLEESLRRLNESRSTTTSSVVARLDEPSDDGDMSEHSHEEWLFLNRNRANTQQLKAINEALQRINEGTYGVCAECEKPISPKRLQAVPWAKFCVPCQEQRGPWTN